MDIGITSPSLLIIPASLLHSHNKKMIFQISHIHTCSTLHAHTTFGLEDSVIHYSHMLSTKDLMEKSNSSGCYYFRIYLYMHIYVYICTYVYTHEWVHTELTRKVKLKFKYFCVPGSKWILKKIPEIEK